MFRLETVARILDGSASGSYLRPVSQAGESPAEARRLADSIMEAILGVYHPPRKPYREYPEYIEAAFAERRNRARADRTFRSLMRQLGIFWGTLLAVRGFSNGESVVARNVGVAARLHNGRWRVDLVFMDHDNLRLPPPDRGDFQPHQVLAGTLGDESFAIGGPERPGYSDSLVDHLRTIYRVSPAASSEGENALRLGLSRAYRRTSRECRGNPALNRLFPPGFLRESDYWDRIVADDLNQRILDSKRQDEPGSIGCITDEMKNDYQDALIRYGDFIARIFGFLRDLPVSDSARVFSGGHGPE